MKQIIYFVAMFLIFIIRLNAQTSSYYKNYEKEKNSTTNIVHARTAHQYQKPERRTISVSKIGGISLITVSLGTIMYGYLLDNKASAYANMYYGPTSAATYQAAKNYDAQVRGVGAIIFGAGMALSIIGSAHDQSMKTNRWSVLAPKKNAIGIAYNF